MGKRRGEPVKNTCPDIDRIILTITNICKQMDNCSEEDTVIGLLENIKYWESDLSSIGFGKWNELEDLRNANAALREWGNDMYNEAEGLEKEKDEYLNQYEEQKNEVGYLKEKIKKLEKELCEIS